MSKWNGIRDTRGRHFGAEYHKDYDVVTRRAIDMDLRCQSWVRRYVWRREAFDATGRVAHERYVDAKPYDWCYTADGWVMRLISTHELPAVEKRYGAVKFIFGVGKRIVNRNADGSWSKVPPLEYLPYRELGYGYCQAVPRYWVDQALRSGQTKKMLPFVVALTLKYGGVTEIPLKDWIWAALHPHARQNAHRRLGKWQRHFWKQPKPRAIVRKRLNEILLLEGFGWDNVLKRYQDAATVAEGEGDAKGMITATDRLAGLLREAETTSGEEYTDTDFELLDSRINAVDNPPHRPQLFAAERTERKRSDPGLIVPEINELSEARRDEAA